MDTTNINKISYIRFDWAIKKILRDKANFKVLEGLISTLINDDVKIEEILESESNRIRKDSKANRVDIKARNHKGEIIIIEVQNLYQMDFLQRILFGTATAITEQVSAGEPYESIKKVYSISIVYFDLGVGKDFIYRGQTSLVGDHVKDVLQLTKKEMEAYQINGTHDLFPEFILIRVNDYQKEAANAVEAWVEYLKTSQLPEKVTAPGFDRLKEVLTFDKMTKEEYKSYMEHLNDLKCEKDSLDDAFDKGLAEGIAEGEKRKALNIAAKLKASGMTDDAITAITGLTATDLQTLI